MKKREGMKELYLIMRDLLELEYNQKSLWYILETMEHGYDDERQGEAMIVSSVKYYLSALQKELRVTIGRLDIYMAEGRRYGEENEKSQLD